MAACDGRSVVGGVAEDNGKPDVFDLDADATIDVTPTPDADASTVDNGAPDASDGPIDTGLPYCTSDEQCGAGSGAPYCDPVLRHCVRCVPGERDRCPAAQHCDPMAYECVAGCRSDEGCARPDGGVSDASAPSDGGAAGAYCEVATHTCVQCIRSAQCPAGTVCAGNACVPGCDPSNACPTGQTCCGGGCVDTQTNVGNCGACGRACAFANAVPVCRMGACAIDRCIEGSGNCDGNEPNGCETSLLSDLTNCGTCARACPPLPSAAPACRTGACVIGVCAGGFGDCDGDATNGCEVDTRVTPAHCSACGMACLGAANADPTCAGSACGIACHTGYGDCDGDRANGCEVDLGASAAHCGACGAACASLARATVTCTAGRCAIGTCEMGYADCNRLAADGCETDTGSDALHCGACGNRCPVGQVCTAGACNVPCPPGQTRCGGVCTNTGNDPSNCGACGASCGAGLLCGGGACASTCSAGQTVCSGACAALATDNQHCGACGNRCATGQQCTAGVCTLVCAAGTTSCGRVCANLLSDNANCGRCGATCSASESCMGGVCTLVCPPTQTPCAGLCVDLTRDSNNCGACGMLCPTGCVGGRCASIVDLEAAQNNTCALYASGRVFCWGLNRGVNTRGGGSFAHNTSPVQVVDVMGAPLESVTQLAGGADAMCARRTNGTVQCWGSGLNLTDLPGISAATDIALRGVNACAVVGGAVLCWNNSLVSAPVAGLTDAVAVAVGTSHNCAVRTSGAVVCWGNNTYGQLGDGTVSTRTGLVTVGGLTDAVAITAGEHFSCARRRGGTVVCWGRNQSGQLGSGSTAAYSASPVEVMGLTGVSLVRAGLRHTCALAIGGALRCWGENTFSQVGDGGTSNRAAPVDVAGLAPQRALALYATHACGLGVDGVVRCWGNNPYGEAGGGTETRSTPAPITGLNDVIDMQQGTGTNWFTGAGTSWRCALRRSGTVECWGSASQGNASGQLGDGTTVNRVTPAPVVGLTDAVQISVGASAACALRRGGTAVCWGYNAYGQIGDGTTVNRPLPTPVAGVPELAEIRTDGNTTCARGIDGSVRCWGYNYWGQLGQNDQVPRPTPSLVAGVGTNARELWVGNGFVCARLASGQVSCWGRNIEGQLADGSSTNRYLPGLVTTTASTVTSPVFLGGITSLFQCGPLHCMARGAGATEVWDWGYTLGATRARTVAASANIVSYSTNYSWMSCSTRVVTGTTTTVCSGYGEFGLLGNNTAPYSGSGTVVGGDRFARVLVSPNAYGPHCAIDTAGQAYCWGWTGDGSLAAAGLPGVNRTPTVVTTP